MKQGNYLDLTLGEIIKYFRKKHGLTQFELADKCGLDKNYITNIERGATNNPTLAKLQAIASAFSIDVSILLFFTLNLDKVDKKRRILYEEIMETISEHIDLIMKNENHEKSVIELV